MSTTSRPSLTLWLTHESRTRQLCWVPDDIAPIVALLMPDDTYRAFARDCRSCNLFEAVNRLEVDTRQEVILSIAAKYEWTLEPTPLVLPTGTALESLIPSGIDVTGKRVPITPDVSWRIRKDAIVAHVDTLRVLAIGATTRSMLDKIIDNTVKQPHERARVKLACETNIYDGISRAPAPDRPALMAKIMAALGIAPAIDAYADGKPKFPQGKRTPRRDRVLVTDTHGNAWTWNMGWFRVGEDGNRLDSKPALGHAKFRRAIVPATPEQLGLTSFRHTRPWGQWRRGSGPADHPLFGECSILITDGVHAVIRLADGSKAEVELDNLRSIGTTLPRRMYDDGDKTKSSRKTRKTREPRPVYDLAFLMTFLNEVTPTTENTEK